ncbi:uncharacterized protein LOC125044096 [Penaeus chinensis]|uniref:uncharacterized protein LOC125044096 n=1 Tax=Penaeus chinensis TaxID=139456 RepID=UPI001FB7CF6D|nr:uncharacterized protein LOC125044096 [Penaeus chinensis]
MCDKRVSARVKGNTHRAVIQPAILYGLETVPQTKKATRLEVAEMKMCRWACGLTMRDRMRNYEIREKMGVTKIGLRCRSARLRWFGHVKLREENYIGKRMYQREGEEKGVRSNGGWTTSRKTYGPWVQGK